MISYERKQAMIIKNGILVLPDRLVSGGIKLTNGVISEIGEPDGCDEVIDAMGRVGSLLSPDLRETGQGGLAATPTGVKIARQLAQEG